MSHLSPIIDGLHKAIKELFDHEIDSSKVLVNPTKKEFEGDYTIVLFPYARFFKMAPDQAGSKIGDYLQEHLAEVKGYNVIKGFLNLELSDQYWVKQLTRISSETQYGYKQSNGTKVLVEFSSPNTNKPLHLGHIRNILLGWSTSKLLKAEGYDVSNVQIINDRGIAICKSMLAWQKYGDGQTPQDAGKKSDHFVGDYYVLFETKFQEEYKAWQESKEGQEILQEKNDKGLEADKFFKSYKNTYFNTYSGLGSEAKEMLLAWEAKDTKVIELWKMMNGWVYEGFDVTYDKMGVSFDKLYYESDTYLLGKESIAKGLEEGIFYQKEDGSVWIDLEDAGMDHKIVLRSDGTSVYMTQDIGTAQKRYEDLQAQKMIYTVADEQDYHFKVLFEILKRLGEPFADGLYHLSYGMVDLTTGKMKSREGTIVDADDLMQQVIDEAAKSTMERGDIQELGKEEQADILRKIGLAALKFFIIKVSPRKRMTFNPEESVDMQGQTGPYIQNAFVRIQSILRKKGEVTEQAGGYSNLHEMEKKLVAMLLDYPAKITEGAENYDPSTIANYCYALAKDYHRFYHDVRILSAESEEAKAFRLQLCEQVANVLQSAMDLLGIEMPSRM